jgi:hypothetical protein
MPSRAVTLHAKDPAVKTSGGLTAKKLMVSPASGEVVDRSKRRQGLKSTWARDTEYVRKEIIKAVGMVLFNVGPDGKKMYKYVSRAKECRAKLGAKDSVTIDEGPEGKKLLMCIKKNSGV